MAQKADSKEKVDFGNSSGSGWRQHLFAIKTGDAWMKQGSAFRDISYGIYCQQFLCLCLLSISLYFSSVTDSEYLK